MTPQDKIVKGNVIATIRDWVKAGLNAKADSSSLTAHTGATNNPHGVTAAQVGLGNVGNFKAVSTVASQGLSTSEKENARANIEAVKKVALTCTLPVSGWSNNEITVACSGVTSSNTVIISPAPVSHDEYGDCGIRCTAQGTDTLTFARTSANSNSLTVNVVIFN